jgi:hypothetical protein
MKRSLLILTGLIMTASAFAQLPVSTTPQNKKVVLEEFTGIYCVYCPDGHRIANQIYNGNTNNVVLINIHVGGFAAPQPGAPDFRTQFGTAIANQSNLTGYPAGTVNRTLFTGLSQNTSNPGTAMSRGSWTNASNQTLAQSSYANVALQGVLDVNTRQLTINVEAYYTANGSPINLLNVAILQNNVPGPQTGATTFYPEMIDADGNYIHNHMLRHLVTGQWGDTIHNTSATTLVSRQYTYTLPANINNVPLDMANLEIVAFLSETTQNIVTGTKGPITYTGFSHAENAAVNSVSSALETCGSVVAPKVKIQNFGSSTLTSVALSYNVNGGNAQTYTWMGSLLPLASTTISLPNISFVDQGTNTLSVNITGVNGGADQNPADNTGSISGIINTNKKASGKVTLYMTQDRYGDEITWKIFNAAGTVVAQGGPYAQLSANGTQSHTHVINASNNLGCYKLEVYDSYGDGINAGYGAGNYRLEDEFGQIVIQSNGQYTSSKSDPFEVISLSSVDEQIEAGFVVFPNPTSGKAIIQLELPTAGNAAVRVTNVVGQIIWNQVLEAGNSHSVEIDLSTYGAGIYFVQAEVDGKVFTKQLSVTR